MDQQDTPESKPDTTTDTTPDSVTRPHPDNATHPDTATNPADAPHPGTTDALNALAESLNELAYQLAPAEQRRALLIHRDRLVEDIHGLASRAVHTTAPLLVVVGGVTGAGKSTLVNTVVGRVVARTGVTPPTTTTPTLICHPQDRDWFADARVLPAFRRQRPRSATRPKAPWRSSRSVAAPPPDPDPGNPATHATGNPATHATGNPATHATGNPDTQDTAHPALQVITDDAVPRHLGVLDAPDSDSVREENRRAADLLLDAADVWVWVTTPGKYADEDSMALLCRARDRGAAAVLVLSQLEPNHDVIVDDLHRLLDERDIEVRQLVTVPRVIVHDERLPPEAAAGLTTWLASLADPQARQDLRRQTLDGALAALPGEIGHVVRTLEREQASARALTAASGVSVDEAARQFAAMLDDGQLGLREQVLKSWVDFIGTGRFQSLLRTTFERVRTVGTRLRPIGVGRQQARLHESLQVQATGVLAATVAQLADLTAAQTAAAWQQDPVGAELLAAHPELVRHSPTLPERTEAAITTWETALRALVIEHGGSRKTRSEVASVVLNAGVVSLMLLVFFSTGGLTGAEVTIAASASPITQLVLERLLGSQNVRWLVAQAKQLLLTEIRAVLDEDARRFSRVVATASPDPETSTQLRAIIDTLDATADPT